MTNTIRYEYTSQDGEPCVLIFQHPTARTFSLARAVIGDLTARWHATELFKRRRAYFQDLEKLEKGESPELPDNEALVDTLITMQADCPPADAVARHEMEMAYFEEVQGLIEGWEVKGERVEMNAAELREKFAEHSDAPFFLDVFKRARDFIFYPETVQNGNGTTAGDGGG